MDWRAIISVVVSIVVPVLFGIHLLVKANDDFKA